MWGIAIRHPRQRVVAARLIRAGNDFSIQRLIGHAKGDPVWPGRPRHTFAGVTLTEIADLEKLAEDCAADGVYEFFYAAAPLKIAKGTGSPVNPIVVK